MEQLRHNGVLIPLRYEGKGLTIQVKRKKIKLTPKQEEMAFAWAKKAGTPYVEDPIFAKNFHRDFSKKLGVSVKPDDVDYSNVLRIIENERAKKANLSKKERKQLAAQRKAQREANKEHYGYAWVDGVRVEVANYAVEPSSIFMGRGKHPLRGRWKEGPDQEDIELNLSPDAPRPPGKWKNIVWQPDSMWIARWQDKLSGKMKYVWFSDSSILKQKRDIEKFKKARELRCSLVRVQRHILVNLNSDDLRRKKTATVCFLIDKLKIRVGDEKDPDEADTIGASTLRPRHVSFNDDATVTFRFLGKDSVPHVFTAELPDSVVENLKEFTANAQSALFDGVDSKHVSEFLDEVMTGLSAKVFRTCYASEAVEIRLEKDLVKLEEPDYAKNYIATMANLEAAKVCNHKRTIPKTWKSSLEKKKDRLKALKNRAKDGQNKLKQKIEEQEERHEERLRKHEERLKALKERLEARRRQLMETKQQGKSLRVLRRRISLERNVLRRQKERLKLMKLKHAERMTKLKQRVETRRKRDEASMGKFELRIEAQKQTRDYNLGTSLKSYIDPRIYYEWGKRVDYDWKQYYPKALQRKFSWVETDSMTSEKDQKS